MSDGEENKRPHRATGKKPPGGRRAGAGRPAGSLNALPKGAVQAIKALRLRVPEGTPEALADIADESFAKIVDVMREKVHFQSAHPVLIAATAIRKEICGPLPDKVRLEGADGGALTVAIEINRTVKAEERPGEGGTA